MKGSRFLIFLLAFAIFAASAGAQKRRFPPKTGNKPVGRTSAEGANSAVVADERLAVLRAKPSLFSEAVMRMQHGRKVSILSSKQADGVTFYRVTAPPNNYGWVQADALISKSKAGDDARLAKLVQSSDGFEQIERANLFLENFTTSPLRPAILLLYGDLLEQTALKLSGDATRRLDRREMAASGAPLHSFYLNFVSLDRYRKMGVNFVFNSSTRLFHYDGAAWREIVQKFPKSNEAEEARKRLDLLNEKMEAKK